MKLSSMVVLGVFFTITGYLWAIESQEGCACKACRCTKEAHCGCYSDKGCQCSLGESGHEAKEIHSAANRSL